MKIRLNNGTNFRSFEGLKTADGKKINGRFFIRGAHLSYLDEEDKKQLLSYSPKTIIDLRIQDEIDEEPDVALDGVEYINIPFFNDGRAGISKSERARLKDLVLHSDDINMLFDLIPNLEDIYASAITDEYSPSAQSKILNICMDNAINGKATIFHCTIGKDRTGITSMLLESLLGVPYEDIIKDYVISKKSTIDEGNKYFLKLLIAKRNWKLARSLRRCFDTRKENLIAVYTAILDKYESVEDYVIRGLGIEKDKIEAFRKAATCENR